MTSGSVAFDRRTPITPGGPSILGPTFSKTWFGYDWPKIPKVSKPPLLNPVLLTANGRKRLDQAILANNRAAIEAYKVQIRSARQRKVKRARTRELELHDYEVTIAKSYNSEKAWIHLPKPPPPTPPVITKGTWDSTFGGIAGAGAIPVTADQDYTLTSRLKSRIVGSSFNLGVFIAELSPALAMIFNAANRLRLAQTAARKGHWGRAARLLRPKGSATKDVRHFYTKGRTVAQNWLELQYGWKPLVSDLQEGALMVAHSTAVPWTLKVRSTLKVNLSLNTASPANTGCVGKRGRKDQLIAYLTEVDVPQLVGLKDWQSIVWERLPFSFVGDWAIPIGNFLAARGVALALQGKFVTTRTTLVECTKMYTVGGNYEDLNPGDYYNRFYLYSRRIVSDYIAVPKPTIKPLNEVLSWKRAANAVALLVAGSSTIRKGY
jgi:hypothetical protein